MDRKPADNPDSYPPLGRVLMWFTDPANANKIVGYVANWEQVMHQFPSLFSPFPVLIIT